MENVLTQRELKRIETDKKIIDAAISIIGTKGYKASNLREIASKAGITPGLIVQRFGTKENLLIQALRSTNPMWGDVKILPELDAYDVLVRIISDLKAMYEDDIKAFNLLYMVSISADVPLGVVEMQKDVFYKNGLYDVLKKAQEAGNLSEGNLAIMYNIFICNALRLIRDYSRAGLRMPNDERFLVLIQYKDLIAEEQQFYRNNAFESVAQSFFILIYFNISTGKFRIAKTIEPVGEYAKKFDSGQDFLNSACEDMVDESYKRAISKFVDLSTVIERIGEKKVIAEDYLGNDGCMYRISFIYVVKEPDNEVVLCGVQKLKESV